MKTIKNFEYVAPMQLEEAVSLLATYKEEAAIIAGGTDLVPMMKDRVVEPKCLVDISKLGDLEYVRIEEDGGLSIGALTNIATIKSLDFVREKFVCIHEAACSFGTTQVRNMATIGGNICRSAPSADMVPPLLVLDAELKLVGPDGERTVGLEEFFTGPGENILKNEILTEIRVPSQKSAYRTAFRKVARSSEDLAKANCAVKVVRHNGKFGDIRIALGAVAPTPVRAKSVEKALSGKDVDDQIINEAVENVVKDIAPITDIRSNLEYRTYISKILIKRLVKEVTGKEA